MILHWFDVASLWIIWWAAFAALMSGHEVRTWRALILQLALLCAMVCAFVGAIATYVQPELLPWWARGLTYAGAAIAGWIYDYKFGVGRHVRMAWSAALCLWNRVRRIRRKQGRLA